MNPDRASILDIDVDVCSNKRTACIEALEKIYGKDHVTRVATFKTEKTRASILTAARSLGIDVDTARYISSLIGAERGIQYTLHQTYYGDEENGLKPNQTFVQEMKNYPDLWKIAQKIEGLVNGIGCHAGGVVITEEPITDSCGIMKTSSGDMVTAYDLHKLEDLSLIKIDLLATLGLMKIQTCLDLLCDYGFVEREKTLKETYEKVIDVYNLDRTSPKMWEMVWNHEIASLFQFEKQSGVAGIALTKPANVEDMATLNSVIRLQPPDRNSERPLEKYARFREDPHAWDEEMINYGLNEHQRELMHSMFDYSKGISAQQEDLYQLMRCPEVVGYTFGQADKLRKCVAKKNPKDYQAFEEQYWKDVEERGSDKRLCEYVWNVLVAAQRGYSFNLAHTFSYSLVALQEMNLCYRFPIIFWNTANLIVDSGAEYNTENEDEEDDTEEEVIEDTDEEEEENDDEDESEEKTKTSSSNYGKIASAIGKMQARGIKVLPPDINESKYTYTLDVEKNTISYGLRGIVKVGETVVQEIIDKRPYTSINDFLERVKVNKTQMVNLIKSGAFNRFGTREKIMEDYIELICGAKKKLTLQNVGALIEHKLLPPELEFEQRVFNFNKYLRKRLNKETGYISLDDIAMSFYSEYFDVDLLTADQEILSSDWKKIYDGYMTNVRKYIVNNQAQLLKALNDDLMKDVKEKYASGSLAKWSMDSVSFYQDKHELAGVDLSHYGVENFFDLPKEPIVDRVFPAKDGHLVKMFKLTRIAGTVIDRDKNKSLITLLTTDGVVEVQAYGVMPQYDKQISVVGEDGKKHVIEKSWFSRGNMIIVNGMRRGENTFVAKKYKNDPGHHFMLIKEVKDNGEVEIQEERYEVGETA